MADLLDRFLGREPTIVIVVEGRHLTATFPRRTVLGTIANTIYSLAVIVVLFIYATNQLSTEEIPHDHMHYVFSYLLVRFLISLLFVWLIWDCAQAVGRYHQKLSVDSAQCQLLTIFFGQVWSEDTFVSTEIKDFRFTQVGQGRNAPILGMKFEYSSKTYKFFKRMKMADAKILTPQLRSINIPCKQEID